MPPTSISPGFLEESTTSYTELESSGFKFYGHNNFRGYITKFEVTESINLFAGLDDLPFDLDLYLGPINRDTGDPFITLLDDTAILNSSTHLYDDPEQLFLQLKPGEYWLGIQYNRGITPTEEQRKTPFKWSLDTITFDKNATLSNDPLLPEQWHLFNSGFRVAIPIGSTQTTYVDEPIAAPNADIAAPEGWKLANDASDIIIAIIDQGIDTTHPDLITNLWTNPGEISGNGIDDDDNDYQDDIHGWNFIDNSPNLIANQKANHGTNVAGIVAAQGNNNLGVSGVAWNAQLMSLDTFAGQDGFEGTPDVEAIYYAVDNGAKVINMSLGGNIKQSPDEYLASLSSDAHQAAFQYAYDNDVFIAIAAGNEANEYANRNKWNNIGDLDTSTTSPALFSTLFGNIASVVASNALNRKSSFSNYGSDGTISAPGGDSNNIILGVENGQLIYGSTPATQILSTMPVGTGRVEDNYGYMAGTSQAAPVISGIAALIRAQDASITAPETLAILRAGAHQNSHLRPYVNQGYQANLYNSLSIAQDWKGPDTLTQIHQDIAPVLNLTALTDAQTMTGTLTLNRESDDDSMIGFYRVLDLDGTILDALGNPVRPGDANYQSLALSSNNLVDVLTNIVVDDDATQKQDYALSGNTNGVFLAPYAVSGDHTWFAWSAANSDGLDHIKVLDSNRFGLEDQAGADGDRDFNDIVMSFVSEQIL